MTDEIANKIIAKLATPPRKFPEIDIEIAETTVKVAESIYLK